MSNGVFLNGCRLKLVGRAPAPAFQRVQASLTYQAKALGLDIDIGIDRNNEDSADHPANGQACWFALQVPELAPIQCNIFGWPAGLAQLGSMPRLASEFTMQAACGLMSVHGRATGRVQALGVPYISTLSATLALQGAMAAALAARRGKATSCAPSLSTSLAAAGLLAVGQYLAGATVTDAPERILPNSAGHANARAATLPFISADQVVFELETLDAANWRTFWSAIGVSMEDAGKGWQGFMLRYAKAMAPMPASLSAALASLPYANIAALCAQTGLSLCKVRTLQERAQDADANALWQQGPWEFTMESALESALSSSALPRIPLDHRSTNLPLAGITVIESCRRIQGPLAGHLLALLGANVIRIEQPGGDPLRGMPPMANGVSARFDALNRLKTVLEIDLKSSDGQAQIRALAQLADVFLHNWAPGKAAEMQLDSQDLRRSNPALIYAYAGGWGDHNAVSSQNLLGTDFMAQAYSGVAQQIAAASGGTRRGGSLFTVLDVLGGVVASQGVVAALLRRSVQVAGIRMESSLLGAANLLCAQELHSLLPQVSAANPVSMPDTDACLQALYATEEGLLAVDCHDAAGLARLAQTLKGLLPASQQAVLDLSSVAAIDAALASLLKTNTAQHWLSQLAPAAIALAFVVEDLCDLENVQRNPLLAPCLSRTSNGMPIQDDAGSNESYTHILSPWRFS